MLLTPMGLQVVTRGPMAIWAIGKTLGKSDWLWAVVGCYCECLDDHRSMTLAFPKQSVIQKLTDKLNSITREV